MDILDRLRSDEVKKADDTFLASDYHIPINDYTRAAFLLGYDVGTKELSDRLYDEYIPEQDDI